MLKELEQARKSKANLYRVLGKRIFDLIISLFALIILSPMLIIIVIVIKIDSKGSAIYKQRRVGKGKKEFNVYKFRTMIVDADKIGPKSTKQGDRRITKVGKILRKYSLDEVPQLCNVLIGNMSIVGYRPGIKENYTMEDLNSELFTVKPGITGYAQVNGRSKLTSLERRSWELKYIITISLVVDIKIVLKTIKMVILSEGTN